MASSEQRNRLANLIQQVIDGELLPEAALKVAETWTDMPWKDRQLNLPWHELTHFQIDEDIRKKDAKYNERMRQQLVLHLNKLRRPEHS